MKHSKASLETFTAYSFIDLLSALGEIIKDISYVFAPLTAAFSVLSYELAVIELLFKARMSEDLSEADFNLSQKGTIRKEIYSNVKVEFWQFMKLWWHLKNPCTKLAALTCCAGATVAAVTAADDEEPEGGESSNKQPLLDSKTSE